MIAFPSNRNLELQSLFGQILSISGSRSPIFFAQKLIFHCRNPNSVKYGSWTNALSKSKVESLAAVIAETEAEAEEEEEGEEGEEEAALTVQDCKRLKALSRITGGPDVPPPPHVLYLLELGVDMVQIKRMTHKFPEFSRLSLDRKIRPIVEFLLSYGLSYSEIFKALVKYPLLCGLSLSSNIIPTMKFLEKLGVDKRCWRRNLYRYPSIIGKSRQKIEDTVDFLYEMGVSADGVGRILTRYPLITGFSLDNNLRPKAEYFKSLGVKVDRLLLSYPRVFGLRLEEKLKPTTEFFLGKRFSKEEFASIVSALGAIYGYSLSKNLIPKWEFFLTMDFTKEELLKYPSYFGYSLEGRIKPRYAVMKESGVEMSLSLLLAPDARFARSLKKNMEKKASAGANVAQIYKG